MSDKTIILLHKRQQFPGYQQIAVPEIGQRLPQDLDCDPVIVAGPLLARVKRRSANLAAYKSTISWPRLPRWVKMFSSIPR